MQWSDVTRTPPPRQLRQFGALWLVFFLGMAAARWWHGHVDLWTWVLAVGAVTIGVAGMLVPAFIRPIFTGWMILAFPIGWTVSRLALGTIFFGIMAPLGGVFRARGRDPLRLRRENRASYWTAKRQPGSANDYFRQF